MTRTIRHAIGYLSTVAPELAAHLTESLVTGVSCCYEPRINVVWTGLNRFAASPQIDPYTGAPHDGYAQDAMFARR